MGILSSHSRVTILVTDSILCVETTLTPAKIRAYVGNDLEMACLEMDDKFIAKLMKTKFKEDEKKNFRKFIKLTKLPSSIDEGLDLINERGGIKFLTDREVATLDRLTNKPKQSPPSIDEGLD